MQKWINSDQNVYEEWERKIQQFFFSYDSYETYIVRLIILNFEGYVLYWSNQILNDVDKGKKQALEDGMN